MKWSTFTTAAVLCLTGASALAEESNPALRARYVAESNSRILGRQAGDRCGPDNGDAKCAGQRCCSMYGYCKSCLVSSHPSNTISRTAF